VKQKEQGDDEAQGIDETFVDAYVLPPSSISVDFRCSLFVDYVGLSMVSHLRVVGALVSTVLSCS
jgi:hypothetical protein